MKKIFLAIILLILTVGLCYYSINYFVLSKNITFTDAGPIGDMFAGLTMPIITIISVILLFFSFREQLEANRIQNKALQEEIKRSTTVKELDQILDLLNDVKDEISMLCISAEWMHNASGHNSIHSIDVLQNENTYRDYVVELSKPIELLQFICSKTSSYKFELRDEQVIYEKIRLIYPEDFMDGIEILINKKNPFPENLRIKLHRGKVKVHHVYICQYLIDINHRLQEEYKMSPEEKIKMLESKKEYFLKLSKLGSQD